MGLLDALKGLKRVMTGEVVRRIDTSIYGGMTTMSLRLKKDRVSNDYYVVLAGISGGNYQYFAFTKDDFFEFSQAVGTIRDALVAAPPSSGG